MAAINVPEPCPIDPMRTLDRQSLTAWVKLKTASTQAIRAVKIRPVAGLRPLRRRRALPGSALPLHPARQLPRRWQLDDHRRSDRRQRFARPRSASAGGSLSRLSTPTASPPGRRPADRHLGNVHIVLPKNRADAPMMPGTSSMAEHQQAAVQIGFQPEVVERHQPRHVLAKDRALAPCATRCR